MENLTHLRGQVYERDKHGAGWCATVGVTVTYVLGHTCYVDARGDPRGRKRVDARPQRNGIGYGSGSGDEGYGYGNGDGYGNGYGDGGSHGNGNGYGNGHDYGCGYNVGNGNGYGYGNGNGFPGQPWQI